LNKPRILVAYAVNDGQFVPEQRERLREFAELVENPHSRSLKDEEKMELLQDVDGAALGRSGKGLTRDMIDSTRRLKVVGLIGSSVKMLEPQYAMDKGITIFNTAPALGLAVAEYTIGLMIAGLRDIPYFASRMETQKWPSARRDYFNLSKKTVGLIGFGAVARHVAHMLRGFDVELLVYDPYTADGVIAKAGGRSVPLDDVMAQSDVVSLHCGSTEETYHMISHRELDMLKDNAVLVNTSRGAVIDEDALASKLPERRFFVCLNVFEREPLPEDSPLRGHENCLLTPHGAGKTLDTYRINSEMLVDDFQRFFRDETPRNLVRRVMLAKMT
jgi:D-3-phosphoglycerate dehydrogenase